LAGDVYVVICEKEVTMKTGLLSLFAGAALMGGVAVAQAGEPLDSSQLDKVTAGALATTGTLTSSGANNIASAATLNCGGAACFASDGTHIANVSGAVTPSAAQVTF
jgi:hypothetical protein